MTAHNVYQWPSESSKYGCFDADYPGQKECPLCHGVYDCLSGNWQARVPKSWPAKYTGNPGYIPCGYDKTDVCWPCGQLVNQLRELPPHLLKALLRRAGKGKVVRP